MDCTDEIIRSCMPPAIDEFHAGALLDDVSMLVALASEMERKGMDGYVELREVASYLATTIAQIAGWEVWSAIGHQPRLSFAREMAVL